MRARYVWSSQRGFTMIEMLISASLLALLLTASLAALLRGQRTMSVVSNRHDLETSFDDLVKQVNQDFGKRFTRRTGENPEFEILPPQPNQPGTCNAVLIRQRFPITGNDTNVRVVRISTTCHGGVMPTMPPTFMTAYSFVCPTGMVPFITYTRWDSEANYPTGAPAFSRDFPVGKATAAMAMCFSLNANGLTVEGGGANVDTNQQVYAFQKRVNFRTDDKNRNIEVLQ